MNNIIAAIACVLLFVASALSITKTTPLLKQRGLTTCSDLENEMAEGMLAEVEYRAIEGFPLYRVGSDGTVWSKNNGRYGVREEWKQIFGSTCDHGYRKVSLFRDGDGTGESRYIHRLVLEVFVGPCPEGMLACHFPIRDRQCNRLDNLRWGTDQENSDDMLVHGTRRFGEELPVSILTESEVIQIRNDYATGNYRMQDLAKRFNVGTVTVFDVLKGKTWTHVAGPIFSERLVRCKLTEGDVLEIRRRYAADGRIRLAEAFGVAEATIRDIATGRTWGHVKEVSCA